MEKVKYDGTNWMLNTLIMNAKQMILSFKNKQIKF